MSKRRAQKREKKAMNLSVKGLSGQQTERIKGGKRLVVFVVPPKEIPSK